jgi:hypothetical protein
MTEVLIPPLDEEDLVLKGQLSDAPELGAIETARKGETHGAQPELRDTVAFSYVHVGRFLSLVAEEVEAKALDQEQRRHAVFLQPFRVP